MKFRAIKYIASLIISSLSALCNKRQGLIIFHGATLSKFNESGKYLYEFLHEKNLYECWWMTDSKEIYLDLLKKNMRVCMHRSFFGLFLYMRAWMVIGTGTLPPNFLGSVSKKTIKVCLHHGSGPRTTAAADGEFFKSSSELVKVLNRYDYFNFTSTYMANCVGTLHFQIPKNKRIVMGLPRCDHLFNVNSCAEALKNKPLSKLILNKRDIKKIILYAPTWRFYDKKISLPLAELGNVELDKVENYLISNDAYMLISIHPIVRNRFQLDSYQRIRYIEEKINLDINELLPEVDVLITDYSSIATDFLIMNRPILFSMPDYDKYFQEIGLLDDIRNDLPGEEVFSTSSFLSSLSKALDQGYSSATGSRIRWLNRYYDLKNHNSRELVSKFIDSLMLKKHIN